jgi:hypothetical protein
MRFTSVTIYDSGLPLSADVPLNISVEIPTASLFYTSDDNAAALRTALRLLPSPCFLLS